MAKKNKGYELSDFMKLRVPEKDKNKDWYKFHVDRIIPAQTTAQVEDYPEMKKLYEFRNNDLSRWKDEVDYYCGSLEEYGATEEDLVPYNPIPNKIEVLKGDMLSRGNNFKIILLTAKAIQTKNKDLYNKIVEKVNNELRLVIEEQTARLEGMSEEEVQQYIEGLKEELTPEDINIKDYLSENEILANKLLEYSMFDQEINAKRLETLEDTVITDRFYLYNGWRNGKPCIDVINPLNVGFHKNPNSPYIQHSDWVWHRDEITVADALQMYGNQLTDDEALEIIQYGHTVNAIDKRHMTEPVFDHTRYLSLLETLGERTQKGIGLHQGTSLTNINFTSTLWRVHVEFKAFQEVVFLTVTDEYNEPITITLDKKADIIPSYASKVKFTNKWFNDDEKYIWSDETGTTYEAEILWIPRRYEVTKLGNDIVVDARLVPNQPDYGDDPWSRFELSYKGGILNSRNAKTISMMQRALPSAFQYMSVKRVQDRELASYVGMERVVDVDQVPDELALDADGNPQQGQDRLLMADVIARKTKTRYYSGSRTANGMAAPTTRGAGVSYNMVDTSPQLINLQQLATMLSAETGMMMGIPPQREAQVTPGTNVTDNRQALVQSTLATQTLFYFIDKVWSYSINEHMFNLRTYLKNLFASNPNLTNHQFMYILPDGTKELLEVTDRNVEMLEDIGLYLFDSGKDQIYFQMMLQSIHAIAQNAGEGVESLSAVLKSLTSANSVEEAHKVIQVEAERQRKMKEAIQKQQEQLQQQMKQQQMELAKYQAELELEGKLAQIKAQGEYNLQRSEIEVKKFAMQNDINENQINDGIEREKMKLESESKEKEKDRQLEREKLEIERRKILG